jgi:hypothetical protein
MTFSEFMKKEKIDIQHPYVNVLQKCYQEGYLQGIKDSSPNYEYSLKYQKVVERLVKLFDKTVNPIRLEQLEKCLDAMDEYRKEHGF